MKSENLDIEQIRKAWTEMGKALGMQTVYDSDPKDFCKKKTALDQLRERYIRFAIMSLVMVFPGFFIFSRGIFMISNLHFWLGLAFAVYFLTASCMDFWLWRGIGSLDPLRMSVSEIYGKSMFYRKRHLQFVGILIPMMIALLGFTGYVYFSEMYFLYGMIAGAICGGIIGVFQFRQFMAEYRELSD